MRSSALATLRRLQPEVPPAEQRAALALAYKRWPDPLLISALGSSQEVGTVSRPPVEVQPPESQAVDAAVPAGNAHEPGREARSHSYPVFRNEAPPELATFAGEWRWESDSRGRLEQLQGAAPAELGLRTLFELDDSEIVWNAFRCRMPFHQVPVGFAGTSWRLSGVPFFDGGRFLGYRGVALKAPSASSLLGAGSSGDSLADVAHEVRSPLNAIMGFAQMIQAETLGPAPEEHRRHAGTIIENATRLLDALDDLIDAARLDQGIWAISQERFGAAMLLDRVMSRYQSAAAAKGAGIAVSCPSGLSLVLADQRSLERALGRRLSELLELCVAGETLLLGGQQTGNGLCFYLTMPDALAGLPEQRLFDTRLAVQGHRRGAAPLLGLGFGLRLVRQLAVTIGGRFEVEAQRFVLTMPMAADEQAVANGEWSA